MPPIIDSTSIHDVNEMQSSKKISLEMTAPSQQDPRIIDTYTRITFSNKFPFVVGLFLVCYSSVTLAFTLSTSHRTTSLHHDSCSSNLYNFALTTPLHQRCQPSADSSSTRLNVWWFGGSSSEYSSNGTYGDDSCELVAVRIDRTSPNSRRISAEISIPRPIDDVWAILTDYDRLATHVPNLVESRRVGSSYYLNGREGNNNMSRARQGQPGDGTYKCRLYQKGSQKIIGFEFGASLVMDMTESILVSGNRSSGSLDYRESPLFPEERKIGFKCIESQFFSEFDGEWKLQCSMDTLTGDPVTVVSYVVDVRPKGPVPVAALEWRIREDVPTNLRAVKKASVEVGYQGVMAMRQNEQRGLGSPRESTDIISTYLLADRNPQRLPTPSNTSNGRLSTTRSDVAQSVKQIVGTAASNAVAAATNVAANRTQPKTRLLPVRVQWYDDETMAKYLKKDK
jgi:hypothetical protein